MILTVALDVGDQSVLRPKKTGCNDKVGEEIFNPGYG
jgi:hypothetical protein